MLMDFLLFEVVGCNYYKVIQIIKTKIYGKMHWKEIFATFFFRLRSIVTFPVDFIVAELVLFWNQTGEITNKYLNGFLAFLAMKNVSKRIFRGILLSIMKLYT